jgi:uncharacterized tellurite resistance protein B-like protein
MAILDWLGLARAKSSESGGDTDTVRRIVGQLEQLEPDRARHIAALAYVLGRAANADLTITREETDKMVEIAQRLGHVPEAQAVLVVEIAKSQNRLFGGTEDFLVTREFRENSTPEERRELLDCLFAVSAADDSISGPEEARIWQIASELGFSHAEFVETRLAYSGKRSVLRGFRGAPAEEKS